MAAKLTGLTHKIAIQLHLMAEGVPFAFLAPGVQSGNFWAHSRIANYDLQRVNSRVRLV